MKRSTANRILWLQTFFRIHWTENETLKAWLFINVVVFLALVLFGGAYAKDVYPNDNWLLFWLWVKIEAAFILGGHAVIAALFGCAMLYEYLDEKRRDLLDTAHNIRDGRVHADDDPKPTAGALSEPKKEPGNVSVYPEHP